MKDSCRCKKTAQKLFPNLTNEELCNVLLSGTSWPMGDCEFVEQQLQELHDNTDHTYDGLMAYAEERFEKSMEKVDYSK